MKIGLLTFQFALNYGALLQAYSLKKVLEDAGSTVEIINYCPQKMLEVYFPRKEIRHPSRTFRIVKQELILQKQRKLFRDFQNRYLELKRHTDIHYLNIQDGAYDTIIVGSDQVWNTKLTYADSSYFLPFEFRKTKKIGYGISIGSTSLDDTLRQNITLYGDDFLSLSFREESAAHLVMVLLGRHYEHVLDPVFLLSKKVWTDIEQKPKSMRLEKFILFYSLEDNQELRINAISASKDFGLPILPVHPLGKDYLGLHNVLKDVGPLEFIWLVHHADYVFTNSFHGLAFSVIFQKCVSVSLHSKLGERSRNLLSVMNIQEAERITDLSKCDFGKLNLMIKHSFEYLVRCEICCKNQSFEQC